MSYIYLISCESDETAVYKIGYSKNPKQRLKELKTGNPNTLKIVAEFQTKHNRKVKSTFHNIYKHLNVNGKWFSLSSKDAEEFLAQCEQMEKNFDALEKADNPFV